MKIPLDLNLRNYKSCAASIAALTAFALFACACAPEKPQMTRANPVPDGTVEPALWGKDFPDHYALWQKTAEAWPAGKSRYKKGSDKDRHPVDKLSEYPYLALLFKGWGFGVEYNEPRGHVHMLEDVLAVDPSRIKAGGVCLTCKTPYAPKLEKELGKDYYGRPFAEVHAKIPALHQKLGVSCIDCHDNRDMSLKISRQFTLGKALSSIGRDPGKLSRQEMRSAVCAQCHVSYAIPKDAAMHSLGVFLPWKGGHWGGISIEDIITHVRVTPEWTQAVTGFKLGFLRHPEFELFSNDSTHWNAGAACADCHMPYTRVGAVKLSDHRVTSPLKNDMKACIQCHAETPQWLKDRVFAIQDRTASMLMRAGYANAVAAKLFEKAHEACAKGKTVDAGLYDEAKKDYEEAFYRLVFIGAENSTGFHNPAEALRVLGDSIAFAGKAESLLRQALAQAGVSLPAKLDLELPKYLNARGEKKLGFDKAVEIQDPFKNQVKF